MESGEGREEGQGVAGNTLSARNAGKSMGKNARGRRKEGGRKVGGGRGEDVMATACFASRSLSFLINV